MRQSLTIAATLLVAFSLTGCGKNPTGAGVREQKIKVGGNVATKAATAKVPGVSSSAAATTPRAVTAPAATTPTVGVTAGPAAATEGSLAVAVKLTGTAAVATVSLTLVDSKDPEQAAEVTVPVVAGVANWSIEELPAGEFNVIVKAMNAAGEALGQGTATATVKAGAANQLKVDLQVNAPVAATPAPTPTPAATPAPEATPTPVATPTPAPVTALGQGGSIAVDVTITD